MFPACGFEGGGCEVGLTFSLRQSWMCRSCWAGSLAHRIFCSSPPTCCSAETLPSSYKKRLIILSPPCLAAVLECKFWLSTMTNLCWGQAGSRGPSRCTLQDSILPSSRTRDNKDLALKLSSDFILAFVSLLSYKAMPCLDGAKEGSPCTAQRPWLNTEVLSSIKVAGPPDVTTGKSCCNDLDLASLLTEAFPLP